MIKVSVVMPVYNSQEYLKTAIDSVLKQTLRDIELILINDGSSDCSGDICKEAAQKDSRVKYISQENQGITKTRNRGLREAAGEYVTFIDNDDIYVEDILEKAYLKGIQYGAEIIKFGYRVEETFVNGICEIRDNCAKELVVVNHENAGAVYDAVKQSGYFNMIWNGIYHRSLFLESNRYFDESVIMGYEDWIFNNNLYLVPDRQVILDKIGYIHYQRQEHSTSKKFHINQVSACAKAADQEFLLMKALNNRYEYHCNWAKRATEYLMEITLLFERKGCDLNLKEKKNCLVSVEKGRAFKILKMRQASHGLSVQQKLFVNLFEKRYYSLLLILTKFYYKFIMLKKSRALKEAKA